MPQFCFSAEQIAASPTVSQGPGWNAMIEGAHKVSNGIENNSTCIHMILNSVNWEVW